MQKQDPFGIISYPQGYGNEIQNYLNRVTLEQLKLIDSKRKDRQFMILESGICDYSQASHSDKEHTQKNRYGMLVCIHCFIQDKHNRVTINTFHNFYINASFIKSIVDNNNYAIFSQAPLPQAFQDFWRACYHFNVKEIFMLCPLGGQSDQYWPNQNDLIQHENLIIKLEKEEKVSKIFTKRMFLMKGSEGERTLVHNHWSGWTDMKIPQNNNGQDIFRYLVEESLQCIDRKELILVHCSAGIGRTGTFGAIIESLRCLKHKQKVSIFQIVNNLRQQRQGSVQTYIQYCFLYEYLSKKSQFGSF